MSKGILGTLVIGTLLFALIVPPSFLVLIELSFAFMFMILVWFLLFKIKLFRELFNHASMQFVSTALLIGFNAWFVIQILLILMGAPALMSEYFNLSILAFAFSASLYLNQKEVSKDKNMMVGIGIMSCAVAGGLFCTFFTDLFVEGQLSIMQVFGGFATTCVEFFTS